MARSGLTEAEALANVQPVPLTKQEWRDLWRASMRAEAEARARHHEMTYFAFPVDGYQIPCGGVAPRHRVRSVPDAPSRR